MVAHTDSAKRVPLDPLVCDFVSCGGIVALGGMAPVVAVMIKMRKDSSTILNVNMKMCKSTHSLQPILHPNLHGCPYWQEV